MTSHRVESFARAAMLGLLAATQTACTDSVTSNVEDTADTGTGAADGAGAAGADDEATGGRGNVKTGTGGATSGGAPGGDGGAQTGGAGEGGLGGGPAIVGVTSTKIIPDLTLEDFTKLCGEAAGMVEVHAACHGAVTGKGFSYDSDTDVFTEHTCAGYNTCTGFSCVLDD